MAEDSSQKAERWKQVVQRAWDDEAFKQRLIANPDGMLEEMGIDTGSASHVIVEDTAQLKHLVLPAKPDSVSVEEEGQSLSDADPAF